MGAGRGSVGFVRSSPGVGGQRIASALADPGFGEVRNGVAERQSGAAIAELGAEGAWLAELGAEGAGLAVAQPGTDWCPYRIGIPGRDPSRPRIRVAVNC